MFFLSVFEFFVCFVLVMMAVTQMLIPSLKGTKMFPMFKREQKLQNEIVELNQKSSEVDLENEIKNVRSTIKSKRKN